MVPGQTNKWIDSISKLKNSTLSKLKQALTKTRELVTDPNTTTDELTDNTISTIPEAINVNGSSDTLTQAIQQLEVKPYFKNFDVVIDKDYLEELEDRLIRADISLDIINQVITDLNKLKETSKTVNVQNYLQTKFLQVLDAAPSNKLTLVESKLNIILVVGVNGTGKTTSIGKLAHKFKAASNKVLIAAGDTFRAAAESQLEIWANRAGVDLIRLDAGANSGAVVFQALERGRKENYDVIIIDTAGRLHNKANLMLELQKIKSIIDKHGKDLPLEILLTLDASCGQNGLQQAKIFTDVCPLTGVILTKLDGTAKGGVVLNIASKLHIPVVLVGLGEAMEDLRDFDRKEFVEALFYN